MKMCCSACLDYGRADGLLVLLLVVVVLVVLVEVDDAEHFLPRPRRCCAPVLLPSRLQRLDMTVSGFLAGILVMGTSLYVLG